MRQRRPRRGRKGIALRRGNNRLQEGLDWLRVQIHEPLVVEYLSITAVFISSFRKFIAFTFLPRSMISENARAF